MSLDVRCEKCGKLLKVDDAPGRCVRCPQCGGRTTIPAHLAGLPRPRVEPNARPTVTHVPVRQEDEEPGRVFVAVAGAMPWVFSALLHMGLFLIMLFLVLFDVIQIDPDSKPVEIVAMRPAPDTFGGYLDPKITDPSRGQDDRRTVVRPGTQRPEEIDKGETRDRVEDILTAGDQSGRSESDDPLGLRDQSARGGRGFYDIPGREGVRNIVYVVDRSGSMADKFDEVRMEMIRSISRLGAIHNFHIILFNANQVVEGPRRHLVAASMDYRLAAGRFLEGQQTGGPTTVLPALKRAFEVLRQAPQDSPGKLIYLLSDGDFAGVTGGSAHRTPDGRVLNGNEAVIQWLRDNNRGKEVMINTILLRCADRSAVEVMRTIAGEHSGQFEHISSDEQ